MAAAPADRILLSQRFRVVKLHRPFNSLPTALAPLSLILLCERSEKRSNELWLKRRVFNRFFRIQSLCYLKAGIRDLKQN